MNKTELVEAIATDCDISKASAHRAVEAVIENIVKALSKGEEVNLIGFGTFYVAERAARSGLNPQTKQKIEIPAGKVPKFRAGKALKDSVK
jgi:DNA-binding protein HU-beta